MVVDDCVHCGYIAALQLALEVSEAKLYGREGTDDARRLRSTSVCRSS